ncbi:MAG: hypothetical protein DI573_14555 [Microbacterium sp.]|jgi:hypothetical protein|uniref:hypothetical protein n=1 Tax=unclassified Microbacterium TaxID=2609290 RepID=UPI000DB67D00|nr:hypothetical protein [Microbacterium sp.]PZU35981.1 MAG: hypothetical protein DI573_14555 [Microbacterium sp.]
MDTPRREPAPEELQKRYRRRRIYLRTGQVIMIGGAAVGIIHWLAHLEAFGPAQPEGWVDLVAGYPAAALLVIVGAVVASRKPS